MDAKHLIPLLDRILNDYPELIPHPDHQDDYVFYWDPLGYRGSQPPSPTDIDNWKCWDRNAEETEAVREAAREVVEKIRPVILQGGFDGQAKKR